MIANLADAPAVQRDDFVRIPNGAQAMRDNQCSAALQHAFERLLDQVLRLCIDRRGRLIQDQDAGVGEDGAGQCEPLPLAAAQLPG